MTTIPLDLRSSGRTVTAAPGDRLELRLEENPTTGFRWRVEDDDSGVLVLEHDAYTTMREGVAGAGGIRELRFVVAKPGQAVLRASNRRSWERDLPPRSTFKLTVTAE
ncbi:MAG TPA: protease inhibitor I42 family protein [Caulobacteraceae bacterium]|nr:protease inhibitor I42 family protein [Caulobacteraceae bacterium]